jgi:hypothetical protein
LHFLPFHSPNAIGSSLIQAFNQEIMRRVFYLCATATGCKTLYCFCYFMHLMPLGVA